VPQGQQPYPHDPEQARQLLAEARWPAGRALRLAAPADLEGVARLLADSFTSSLRVEVDLTVIPPDQLLAAQHALVEKVLPLPFDVLVHAWFDLAADAPPAVLHREFFHATGAFRAGPPIAEFQELLGRFAAATDPGCWGSSPPTSTGSFTTRRCVSSSARRRRCMRSTGTSPSMAMPPPSSWPRPRRHRSTGRDARHFTPRDGVASWMRCCFRRALRDRHRLRRRHGGDGIERELLRHGAEGTRPLRPTALRGAR
jgi:hypothetical protein